MGIYRAKQEFSEQKIEFESNKTLLLIEKFWQFSRFYGDYLATMSSSSKRQLKLKYRKDK